MISIGFTISHKLATFENWQKWYCGSDDETRRHSYKTIAEECPDVLDQFNECCWVHDQCYADQLGKINCDNHFCQCLDIIAMKAKHYDDCKMNAWWACFAVQVFGDHAYVASASQNRTMKTSTVTKKDTTTTNAPTVCVIDDEEVHEHYKMASNTCRDQKNEFTKCCEQHTMCHRNLSNNPKFCHKAFASCLIDHINEDNNSDSDCRKAAYLIYNELSGEGSDEPKGFIYTLRYWINRIHLNARKTSISLQNYGTNLNRYFFTIIIIFIISTVSFILSLIVMRKNKIKRIRIEQIAEKTRFIQIYTDCLESKADTLV